ncbi:MAG: hypothetical protein MJE68_18920 [Proteobacteria bacterium]|nr:hypothetical protein [Pseudomonadota bacterium]
MRVTKGEEPLKGQKNPNRLLSGLQTDRVSENMTDAATPVACFSDVAILSTITDSFMKNFSSKSHLVKGETLQAAKCTTNTLLKLLSI